MPTYDYECKSCGHEFEYFQAMSAEPLRNCPQCGGEVRRLIGGGMGVIFKGSGFYVTDNRGSGGIGKSGDGSTQKKGAEQGGSNADSNSKPAESKGTKGKNPSASKVEASKGKSG